MGALKTAYLVAYNAASMVGWAYIIAQIAQHFQEQPQGYATLYDRVAPALKVVQTAAFMEVFHSLVGLVRSPVSTTFIQVFSRVFVLWGICHVAPPAQTNWPFTLMVASWSLVEVPRYLFYIVKLLVDEEPKRVKRGEPAPPKVPTKVPYPLLWIRYSLFLVLYVTGITGELGCLFSSLDYVKAHRVLTWSLPNAHNFALNWWLFLWIVVAIYVPGSYTMYTHMLGQRSKELYGVTGKKDGKTTAPAAAGTGKEVVASPAAAQVVEQAAPAAAGGVRMRKHQTALEQ